MKESNDESESIVGLHSEENESADSRVVGCMDCFELSVEIRVDRVGGLVLVELRNSLNGL